MKKLNLEEILDRFPSKVALDFASQSESGVITAGFSFSEKGFGFGEICIVQTPEGVFIDTEHTSKERTLKYLTALVDSAILDVDNDPEKHQKYNEVMGRRCGDQCKICHPC